MSRSNHCFGEISRRRRSRSWSNSLTCFTASGANFGSCHICDCAGICSKYFLRSPFSIVKVSRVSFERLQNFPPKTMVSFQFSLRRIIFRQVSHPVFQNVVEKSRRAAGCQNFPILIQKIDAERVGGSRSVVTVPRSGRRDRARPSNLGNFWRGAIKSGGQQVAAWFSRGGQPSPCPVLGSPPVRDSQSVGTDVVVPLEAGQAGSLSYPVAQTESCPPLLVAPRTAYSHRSL